MGNASGSYSTSGFALATAAGRRNNSLMLRSLTGLQRSCSVEALCRDDGGVAELDVVIQGTLVLLTTLLLSSVGRVIFRLVRSVVR